MTMETETTVRCSDYMEIQGLQGDTGTTGGYRGLQGATVTTGRYCDTGTTGGYGAYRGILGNIGDFREQQ